MRIGETIAILKTERECIRRNNGVNCDRNCVNCDLLMDAQIVEEAYDMAIDELEKRNRRSGIALMIAATLPSLGFIAASAYLVAHGHPRAAICFFIMILVTLPRYGK